MKKGIVFSLVLILGISIGHFAKARITDSYVIRLSSSEYSFNKDRFKDPIWDVIGYEEYSVLEDYSDTEQFFTKLERVIYKIQKVKEKSRMKSRIIIQFTGNHISLESMEIQEMVEAKFSHLDIVYMYLNNGETDLSTRIGFIY
jgi:hypothetical protein